MKNLFYIVIILSYFMLIKHCSSTSSVTFGVDGVSEQVYTCATSCENYGCKKQSKSVKIVISESFYNTCLNKVLDGRLQCSCESLLDIANKEEGSTVGMGLLSAMNKMCSRQCGNKKYNAVLNVKNMWFRTTNGEYYKDVTNTINTTPVKVNVNNVSETLKKLINEN